MEERELLRILETAFIHLKKDVNYKETKRKYQQALEEIAELIKKPKVSKAFIGKITARIYCNRDSSEAIKTCIREAFEEVGVRVA